MKIRNEQGTNSFENLEARCACSIDCNCQTFNHQTNHGYQRETWKWNVIASPNASVQPY